MKLIGLTGGIASGKTMVTDYLRSLGAPLVDADEVSRAITADGSPVLAEIAEAFGADCLDEKGSLRRKMLAGLIFDNAENREKLNGIIHPKVTAAMQAALAAYEKAGETVAIYAAPLLLEAGGSAMYDAIWVVALDPEEQLRRLMARDGIDEEAARKRLDAQTSLAEKLAKADKVIDNNGSREEAMAQAKALWEDACGA